MPTFQALAGPTGYMRAPEVHAEKAHALEQQIHFRSALLNLRRLSFFVATTALEFAVEDQIEAIRTSGKIE